MSLALIRFSSFFRMWRIHPSTSGYLTSCPPPTSTEPINFKSSPPVALSPMWSWTLCPLCSSLWCTYYTFSPTCRRDTTPYPPPRHCFRSLSTSPWVWMSSWTEKARSWKDSAPPTYRSAPLFECLFLAIVNMTASQIHVFFLSSSTNVDMLMFL